MKLYLYRTRTRQLTTDGVLMGEDRVRICDTAEHTPTMLPAGTYKVKFRKHKGHRAPFVQQSCGSNVSNGFKVSGCFLLPGNGVHGKGFGATIIVGDHLAPGVVIRSRPYFDRLVKRLEKVFKRGGEVELVIAPKPPKGDIKDRPFLIEEVCHDSQ